MGVEVGLVRSRLIPHSHSPTPRRADPGPPPSQPFPPPGGRAQAAPAYAPNRLTCPAYAVPSTARTNRASAVTTTASSRIAAARYRQS